MRRFAYLVILFVAVMYTCALLTSVIMDAGWLIHVRNISPVDIYLPIISAVETFAKLVVHGLLLCIPVEN